MVCQKKKRQDMHLRMRNKKSSLDQPMASINGNPTSETVGKSYSAGSSTSVCDPLRVQ